METVISADSHFVEPPEMWVERVDREYKDRAPHIVKDLDGKKGSYLVCEDLPPSNGGADLAAGVDRDDLAEFLERGYDGAPPHMRVSGQRGYRPRTLMASRRK